MSGRSEWIYLVKSGSSVKVGRTRRLDDRVSQLQTGSPYLLTLIRGFRVPSHLADRVERDIRSQMFEPMMGEWVSWQPGMERIADGVVAAALGWEAA